MFNPTTLRIIAEGGHVPDQQYIQEMARALLDKVYFIPRPGGALKDNGSPFWHDIHKGGLVVGNIYSGMIGFTVELDGGPGWVGFHTFQEAKIHAENKLK